SVQTTGSGSIRAFECSQNFTNSHRRKMHRNPRSSTVMTDRYSKRASDSLLGAAPRPFSLPG
ncbi:hypothetical protein KUCAC02_001088, partial [Chaenocephalus aceratus]